MKYYDLTYIPVELISFEGKMKENTIVLYWVTGSELNNRGFYIEKSVDKINWETVAFINGKGTTTETNEYNFVDEVSESNEINYRLKQVDFEGSFKYSEILTLFISNIPATFELSQNYPNPFNPNTTINYAIKNGGLVKIRVYDILGREIEMLVNEVQDIGNHSVEFNASFASGGLPSGVYIYTLQVNGFSDSKKMLLLK